MTNLKMAISIAMSSLCVSHTYAEEKTHQNKPETDQNPVEEITIYGDKLGRNIQDTTVSVAVLSEDEIQASAIQSFNDVFNRVANVSDLRGGNEGLFAIRGVSVQGVSNNANSFTAGVYVDDVALDNLAIRYGVMGIWDAAQIEVFRGPQATLQGRNSLNGAIYVKTNDPTYEWEGHGQFYYGSHATTRMSFAAGGPLIENELAFRISADQYGSDGFVNNVTRDEDDYAGFERQTLRGKVLWEPANIDQLSLLLTATSTRNDIGDNPNTRLDDPFSFEALSDDAAEHNISADMASLKATWDFSDNFYFTSISALGDDEYDRLDDFDSSSSPGSYILQTGKSDTFSQEFRLNFSNDLFSGVVGLYYGEIDRDADWDLKTLYPRTLIEDQALFILTSPTEFGGFGLDLATANAILGYVPDLIDIENLFDSNYKIENMAAFADITWHVSEQLSFSIGARYDEEKQSRSQGTVNSVNTVIPIDNSIPGLTDAASLAAQQLLDFLESSLQEDGENVDTSYEAFLPKLAIKYDWTDELSTAFTVQTGYRAGGSSVRFLTSQIEEFEPEFTRNYELSLKSILLGGKLRFNTNVFYTDWEDQQVDIFPVGAPRDSYIGNAGESELYGFEMELTGYASDRLTWFANTGYVNCPS